jgi:hypothetical protein
VVTNSRKLYGQQMEYMLIIDFIHVHYGNVMLSHYLQLMLELGYNYTYATNGIFSCHNDLWLVFSCKLKSQNEDFFLVNVYWFFHILMFIYI